MACNRRPWYRARPIGDEEFIQRIRLQVALYRRWRWWLLALYGSTATGFIGLSLWIATDPAGMMRRLGWGGFGLGIFIGITFGLLIHQIGFGLVSVLVPPRTERLLLRYHDLSAESIDEPSGPDEQHRAE